MEAVSPLQSRGGRLILSGPGVRENPAGKGDMADTTSKKKRHPLRQVPVVFLDVETTGLDPRAHEIVEIAIVALDGQVLLDTKVKPQNIEAASPRALEINGYNEADWADAPTFDEIKGKVMDALGMPHKLYARWGAEP